MIANCSTYVTSYIEFFEADVSTVAYIVKVTYCAVLPVHVASSH